MLSRSICGMEVLLYTLAFPDHEVRYGFLNFLVSYGIVETFS